MFLLLICGPVLAAERVALVIGNTIYDPSKNHDPSKGPVDAPNLVTAGNDAETMRRCCGKNWAFEVILRRDVGLDRALACGGRDGVCAKAAAATMCLVYFAGHGVERGAGGQLPAAGGGGLEKEAHLETQDAPWKRLPGAVQSLPARTRLVVLDCCRNNPLEGRSWYNQNKQAGVSGGLGPWIRALWTRRPWWCSPPRRASRPRTA